MCTEEEPEQRPHVSLPHILTLAFALHACAHTWLQALALASSAARGEAEAEVASRVGDAEKRLLGRLHGARPALALHCLV